MILVTTSLSPGGPGIGQGGGYTGASHRGAAVAYEGMHILQQRGAGLRPDHPYCHTREEWQWGESGLDPRAYSQWLNSAATMLVSFLTSKATSTGAWINKFTCEGKGPLHPRFFWIDPVTMRVSLAALCDSHMTNVIRHMTLRSVK